MDVMTREHARWEEFVDRLDRTMLGGMTAAEFHADAEARGLSEEHAAAAAVARLFAACNGRHSGPASHEASVAILDSMNLDLAASLEWLKAAGGCCCTAKSCSTSPAPIRSTKTSRRAKTRGDARDRNPENTRRKPMIGTKRVPGVADEEGAFSARVYVVEGPPDADGDVILRGAIEDGARVVVSAGGHDVLAEGAEPAGEARLYHGGNAVMAIGRAFATERGRLLRQKLRDPAGEWSVGYRVLDARPPTREERRQHPATRRVIVKWQINEISPVTVGSCGPTCATLVSKGATCAGPCCGEDVLREAALRELITFEYSKFLRAARERERRWALRDAEAATKRARDVTDPERAILKEHELTAHDVPIEIRLAAWEAVGRAAEVLGGAAPAVRWFSAKAIPLVKALGLHFPGETEIWLAARADAAAVAETASHEVHHAIAIKGDDERAAEQFAAGLSLLRHVRLHVGRRAMFEDHLEREPSDGRWKGTYLAPTPARLHLVGGLPAGEAVVDAGVLYRKTEDGWRRVAALVA